MNNPKIHDIQRAIGTELTMRWPLKAIMRKLGGGTGHSVDCEIEDLPGFHIDPYHLETCRRDRFCDCRDRRQIAKTGHKCIALKTKHRVVTEINTIGSDVRLKGNDP